MAQKRKPCLRRQSGAGKNSCVQRRYIGILISDGSDRVALRIGQEAARLGLRVVTVQRKVLDRLAEGQRHQGVVAKVDAYCYLPACLKNCCKDLGNHGFKKDLDTRRLNQTRGILAPYCAARQR